jgi:hypothetical protein
MAEKLTSPGIRTFEVDQTLAPQAPSVIAAAIIGTTQLGPAFIPTMVGNYDDFAARFGASTNKHLYVPNAAREYLANVAGLTVVRVMSVQPWATGNTRELGQNSLINILKSGKIVASLLPTVGTVTAATASSISSGSNIVAFTSGTTTVTSSLLTTATNRLDNVFGLTPESTVGPDFVKDWYVYYWDAYNANSGSAIPTVDASASITFDSTNATYQKAATPWITSQRLNSGVTNLFKFETISDGTAANRLVKVVIDGIKKPTNSGDYGTFNVMIRDFNDKDNNQVVLESFIGCSMNPQSPDFILKKIGDVKFYLDTDGTIAKTGQFPNKSRYLRVVGTDALYSLPSDVVPFGHSAYSSILSGSITQFSNPIFREYQGTASSYQSYIPWGIILDGDAIEGVSNRSLCNAIPNGAVTLTGSVFNLDDKSGHAYSSIYTASLSGSTAPSQMLKFMVGFQGGYDGSPANATFNVGESITTANTFGMSFSSTTSSGSLAYTKALALMANKDEYNIKHLITPGINMNQHWFVVDYALNMSRDREDLFYIPDLAEPSVKYNSAIDIVKSKNIDNNYGGVYHPWTWFYDKNLNKNVLVPPSVPVLGAYGFNERFGAPWFAPAGMERASLFNVVDTKEKLPIALRNELYENRINPITSMANGGPIILGQKTLQKAKSALDRINIRMLLITIKKKMYEFSNSILFQQNTPELRIQVKNMIEPYLESIKKRSGISWYEVIVDDSNNTPESIDNNMLKITIQLKPIRSTELIEVTFNLTPTGVQ